MNTPASSPTIAVCDALRFADIAGYADGLLTLDDEGPDEITLTNRVAVHVRNGHANAALYHDDGDCDSLPLRAIPAETDRLVQDVRDALATAAMLDRDEQS